MNIHKLVTKIMSAYPMPTIEDMGKDSNYPRKLRDAIQEILEPEWKKLHEQINASNKIEDEKDKYKSYLNMLLTWLEVGIPEKEVNHICGQPDVYCDGACVDFARFCADICKIKKELKNE